MCHPSLLPLPSDVPIDRASVWYAAALSGYSCGISSGYQEQNPYSLSSPLFDAWRSGWFEGIYDCPSEIKRTWGRVPKNLSSILSAKWIEIYSRP